MAKLLELIARIQLPDGATGGEVEVRYPEAYVTPAGVAGGMYAGRVVPIANEAPWANFTNKTMNGPMKVFGGDVGDPFPPLVTIIVTPEGPNVSRQKITLYGYPNDTDNDGKWNFTGLIDDLKYISPDNYADIAAEFENLKLNSARVTTELANLQTAIGVLDIRSAGLAGLNVAAITNAFTEDGRRVLFGLEGGDRLALLLDELGKLWMQDVDIKDLNVTGTTRLAQLLLTAAHVGALSADRLTMPGMKISSIELSAGYSIVFVDKNDRIGFYLDENGVLNASEPGPEFAVEGAGGGGGTPGGNVETTTLRAQQLYLGGSILRAMQTASGTLTIADILDRIALQIDGGGVLRTAVPPASLSEQWAVWGGDLAEGVAGRLGLTRGRTTNYGITGQTSGDMAARFGAMARCATFVPIGLAAGVYSLTVADRDLSPLMAATDQQQQGRMSGVRGTLKRTVAGLADAATNRTGYYTFTPTLATDTIETGVQHTWIPDNADRWGTVIIAVGRADLDDAGADSLRRDLWGRGIADNVQAVIQSLTGRHDRYVVLGLLNTKLEVVGQGLEQIMTFNARLASVAGDRYLNTRSILCRDANGAWRADGSPNPAWMADNVRPNATGLQKLADAIIAFINERKF